MNSFAQIRMDYVVEEVETNDSVVTDKWSVLCLLVELSSEYMVDTNDDTFDMAFSRS